LAGGERYFEALRFPIDVAFVEHQIVEPQGQAIDQHRRGRRCAGDRAGEIKRCLNGPPLSATAAAMLGDPRRHLGIERFRGCDVDPRRRRRHDGLFREAALAGARAAEDKRQLRVLTGQ